MKISRDEKASFGPVGKLAAGEVIKLDGYAGYWMLCEQGASISVSVVNLESGELVTLHRRYAARRIAATLTINE